MESIIENTEMGRNRIGWLSEVFGHAAKIGAVTSVVLAATGVAGLLGINSQQLCTLAVLAWPLGAFLQGAGAAHRAYMEDPKSRDMTIDKQRVQELTYIKQAFRLIL
ncbi:MAG TPA: hypothetical protein VIN59_07245 [Alphaproteobacteria bacterium]